MMEIRPIFSNEVLGKVAGSFEPQYDVISGDEVVAENAVLKLKNPVTAEGTPLNAANMNNMFDYDNFEAMRGHRRVTHAARHEITETVSSISTGRVVAKRVTTFPAGMRVRVETTVFAEDGETVVRQTTVETNVGTDVVEEVR